MLRQHCFGTHMELRPLVINLPSSSRSVSLHAASSLKVQQSPPMDVLVGKVNRPLLGQGQQRAVLEMRHSSAQVQQKREGAEHRASLERGSLGLHADQGSDTASHPSPAISSAPTSPASPALLRDARRTSPAASGSLNRSRSPVMEASPAFGSHASKFVQHGEEAKRAPRDAMVAAKEAGSAAASLQGLAHYYRSRPVPFVCAITLVKGQRARGAACCSCCMPCLSCAREHA